MVTLCVGCFLFNLQFAHICYLQRINGLMREYIVLPCEYSLYLFDVEFLLYNITLTCTTSFQFARCTEYSSYRGQCIAQHALSLIQNHFDS